MMMSTEIVETQTISTIYFANGKTYSKHIFDETSEHRVKAFVFSLSENEDTYVDMRYYADGFLAFDGVYIGNGTFISSDGVKMTLDDAQVKY